MLLTLILGYYTICPRFSASSANFPSAQAESGRGWNSQNQSQPNPGSLGDGLPCTGWPLNVVDFDFVVQMPALFCLDSCKSGLVCRQHGGSLKSKSAGHPICLKISYVFPCEFPGPAWAVGSYSISQSAGGTSQNIIFKTLRQIGRPAL